MNRAYSRVDERLTVLSAGRTQPHIDWAHVREPCPHCEDKDAEIAYLKSELGLTQTSARIANYRKAFGITIQTARVLIAMVDTHGRLLTNDQIETAMERPNGGVDKIVDVNICRLRKALGFDAFETVWGLGYRITPHGLAKVKALCP